MTSPEATAPTTGTQTTQGAALHAAYMLLGSVTLALDPRTDHHAYVSILEAQSAIRRAERACDDCGVPAVSRFDRAVTLTAETDRAVGRVIAPF